MKKQFISRVYIVLTSRIALLIMISAISYISFPILIALFDYFMDKIMGISNKTSVSDMIDASDGVATLFVGLGVFLESRSTITKIAWKRKPPADIELQEKVNRLSENYGVAILINGLLMEIFTQYITIPDSIINTNKYNDIVLAFCLAICITTFISLWTLMNKYIQSFFFSKEQLDEEISFMKPSESKLI